MDGGLPRSNRPRTISANSANLHLLSDVDRERQGPRSSRRGSGFARTICGLPDLAWVATAMDKPTKKSPGAVPRENDVSQLGPAKRRSIAYIPGGMRTVVIGTAILLVALLVWAIQPSGNATRPNRAAFNPGGQALPVGVAMATSGEIYV